MSAPKMTAREWGLLILLSFLWGGAFFFAAVALKEVTHHGLAFFRVAIAAIALGLTGMLLRLPFPKGWAVWGGIAVLGLFSTAIPFTLIYWAQTHIASGLAAILNAMTPIFTLVVAHFYTRDEKMDGQRLFGVLAGIGGVAIIVGPSAVGRQEGHVLAEVAVLGAGLCYAIASVWGRRFASHPPVTISFAQMAVGTVYLLPVMLLTGEPLRVAMPSLTTIGAVLAIGLLSTALAFVMFFRILARAGATNAILVTLLVPVSAILLGVLVLGESLGPRQFGGLILIALGLLINDGRPLNYARGWLAGLRQRPDVSGRAAPHMLNEPHRSQ
jgi:drug/metabolite transporter (DMT)-like permease